MIKFENKETGEKEKREYNMPLNSFYLEKKQDKAFVTVIGEHDDYIEISFETYDNTLAEIKIEEEKEMSGFAEVFPAIIKNLLGEMKNNQKEQKELSYIERYNFLKFTSESATENTLTEEEIKELKFLSWWYEKEYKKEDSNGN